MDVPSLLPVNKYKKIGYGRFISKEARELVGMDNLGGSGVSYLPLFTKLCQQCLVFTYFASFFTYGFDRLDEL
ncbi:hypothetical protein [Pseudoalteromonas luteoviolacea]|uniref:hypothetical protein n=1 Tax=Pseudoalteromonas luteoviolacea TaxID=43657 RepID=UPI0012DA0E29|nr:hypothetical protein [Pseudoalteromonas luteoviolacea]MBQ4905019.1 hypothetical protein [Pseudoalteromonas luteoviolacea]